MPDRTFWQYEFIPEIAHTAIPRAQQEEAYKDWHKTKSKRSMNNILRTFGKLINSEITRYQGTLSRPVLLSFAKKYTADAVKSYNPASGNQLSTHIVNQLQRLHRLNYRNVQGLRSSEDVQSKMNTMFQVRADLADELGRSPTAGELSDRMGLPVRFIEKMHKQIKLEKDPGEVQSLPINMDDTGEREVVDFLYYELPTQHKKILEYKTGYGGSPVLSNAQIARMLKLSPVRVTQISKSISDKFKRHMGAFKR